MHVISPGSALGKARCGQVLPALAQNYIGNIERAGYKVTVETLARIAKTLKVRVRDLVEEI